MKTSDFKIVGLGASAGGLDALKLFFRNLPVDPPAAYIVIMHLPVNYKTRLDQVLSGFTSLKVVLLEENSVLQPDTVYVLPGYLKVTLKDKVLMVQRRGIEPVNRVIDEFFFSLAEELGAHATGVIFSGSGADGASGMQAIHEKGGRVIVQDPSTSQYSGMPDSAIRLDQPEVMKAESMGDSLQQ